jgi:nucleoside-diphosphate-sugar epimerase
VRTERGRYLVTGALGAIGAWTTKTLLDRGYEVVAFDVGHSLHRLELALEPESDAGRLRNVHGDITSLDELSSVLTEHAVTNVVHLAALQIPSVASDQPSARS